MQQQQQKKNRSNWTSGKFKMSVHQKTLSLELKGNLWNKTHANHISDMRLISRIHRELLKLNNKTKPYTIFGPVRNIHKTFSPHQKVLEIWSSLKDL